MTFEELVQAKKDGCYVRVRDSLGWRHGKLNGIGYKYSFIAFGTPFPDTPLLLIEYPNENIELSPTMEELIAEYERVRRGEKPNDL